MTGRVHLVSSQVGGFMRRPPNMRRGGPCGLFMTGRVQLVSSQRTGLHIGYEIRLLL